MNAIVNYEAIEHAAAMANLQTPMADILKMIESKKFTPPVKRVIESLIKGEQIKEPEVFMAENQPPQYDKEISLILDRLKKGNCHKTELEKLTGLTPKKTGYLLQLLRRRNLVGVTRSGENRGIWQLFDPNSHAPVIIKSMVKNRSIAKENGQKYYHGSAHYKCGSTLRLTSSGDCVECKKLTDSKRMRVSKLKCA